MRQDISLSNDVAHLDLEERKEILKQKLKNNNNFTEEELEKMLSYDNTNEDLLFKYIMCLDKDKAHLMILKYSQFISVSKIRELTDNKFGKNIELGFRKKTFKEFFFGALSALVSKDIKKYENIMLTIYLLVKSKLINNQPFDTDNFEALYFYLCYLLCNKWKINEKKEDKYYDELAFYLSELQDFKVYALNQTYEEEKKDLNKFLIVCFSILNLNKKNYDEIEQVLFTLNKPKEDDVNQAIKNCEFQISRHPSRKIILEQFRTKFNKNDFNDLISFKISNYNIDISEKSFRYEYLIKNNIYKRYDKQIFELLNIMYSSDLLKYLIDSVYNTYGKKGKHFFNRKDSIEKLWNNIIIFVPFKLEEVSGFSYRHFSKIFIPIYMICHFKTKVENEIFTLGAFIRIIIHETLGHFLISYKYFMFYANLEENLDSPRMIEQIKNINKEEYIEFIGKKLAEIAISILNNPNIIEDKEEKLSQSFEKIIGKDYAKSLASKLIKNKKDEKYNEEQNIIEKVQYLGLEEKKEDFIRQLSNKITDILFDLIFDEFDSHLSTLKENNKNYQEKESGNIAEFLLFGDFSQNLTLKQCMFLLNEENYKNTNLFEFRMKFKNLIYAKNDEFLLQTKNESKIFGSLFSDYYEIYQEYSSQKNNFNEPKLFRKDLGDNFDKNFQSFNCFFVKNKPLEELDKSA